LNRRADNSAEMLPVLPFRSGKPIATTPLVIQKENSRLRISSMITPRPANPLLAVPTLDKRTVSAPMPQPVPLMSPVLVDKDEPEFTSKPVRRRSTFKHEFFRAGSLKDSQIIEPSRQPTRKEVEPHPLQKRMNSLKEPAPAKRKWSSRLRPGGRESIIPL